MGNLDTGTLFAGYHERYGVLQVKRPSKLPAAEPRYMPAVSYGQRVGVGKTKVFELMASGFFPSIKIGRKRLVDVPASDANLASLNVNAV